MSLEPSFEREVNLLKKELQTITQIKNNEILQLKHRLDKAHLHNKVQQERIAELQLKIRETHQNNSRLELFARQRSQALTHKNIRIAQLEEELERCVNRQAQRWGNQVAILKSIISDQQAQLSNYLQDHHNYLTQLEKIQQPYRYLHSERALLLQFNQELQNQIESSQQAGRELQEWASKANQELRHQNEQGNDLLGQIQYIVQQVAHS